MRNLRPITRVEQLMVKMRQEVNVVSVSGLHEEFEDTRASLTEMEIACAVQRARIENV